MSQADLGEGQPPGQHQQDDPYSGFNDYDHAYDLENVYADREFVQAVARSSHGRRPTTGGFRSSATSAGLRLATGAGAPLPSQMGSKRVATMSRLRTGNLLASGGTGMVGLEPARPMTAVRAAGYSTAGGRRSTFETAVAGVGLAAKVSGGEEETPEEGAVLEKVRKQEEQAGHMLRESVFAAQDEPKRALDKAKEAARKWRAADTLRKNHSLDQNMDLGWTVLLCLAQQKQANNIPSEALQIYHTVVKDKNYVNGNRLKVNMGNIQFRKRDFTKAIKYYRMALDQMPKVHQRMRTKILNNIGVTLVRLGRYEDALATFEECLDSGQADYGMALNLIMAAYCLGNDEKMREAFQRLVDIGPPSAAGGDELHQSGASGDQDHQQDVLAAQLLASDQLSLWERKKRSQAERTILLAAKIISPSIGSSFAEGHAWCVDSIRQSVYASLATELEMNKAVELLRQGQLDQAVEELVGFSSKADNQKVASAASNNLALVNIVRGGDRLEDAEQYCEQALSLDRYNANALVNKGNIYFSRGQLQLALQCYREALQVEAGCTAAIFNSGLACRSLGQLDEAKRHFFKLNDMLANNVQVLVQLAQIYEQQGEGAQAMELYTQASSLAPSDPAILGRMAVLFEAEGDRAQAFQCHYDSFRHFPANIEVVRWLGNYYLFAQFAEKAVQYFERAALMEPGNPEWPMLMASCQRRSGNFQRALELYKHVHRKFPNNTDCLKFLVQLCKELRMPAEEREYADKLGRLQRIGQLRAQRESDSAGGVREMVGSPSGESQLHFPTSGPPSTGRRTSPAGMANRALLLEGGQQFQASKRDITAADLVWRDPGMSSLQAMPRPMTGVRRGGGGLEEDLLFENDEGDELLPE